jgi:hypothetical protein
MTTLRPFDISSHRPLSRKIEREWKSGEATVKPGETRPTETVIHFTVRHCKDRKAFIASLTPQEHHEQFIQWVSNNPGVTTLVERVGRYSEKALTEFSKKAYEHLVDNSDHPEVARVLNQIPGIVVAA